MLAEKLLPDTRLPLTDEEVERRSQKLLRWFQVAFYAWSVLMFSVGYLACHFFGR